MKLGSIKTIKSIPRGCFRCFKVSNLVQGIVVVWPIHWNQFAYWRESFRTVHSPIHILRLNTRSGNELQLDIRAFLQENQSEMRYKIDCYTNDINKHWKHTLHANLNDTCIHFSHLKCKIYFLHFNWVTDLCLVCVYSCKVNYQLECI